ncbi:MAG: hypothetical protein ACREBB_04530 [Nitrosotalea sp.]
MKILHLLIIIASIVIATSYAKPVHADSTDPVQILGVQVEPSMLKVNDTFLISATILNSSPYPIYLTSGSCVPAFSVSFDIHARQVHPNIFCTLQIIVQKVDPQGETTISNANKPGTIYQAVLAGTANANITIPYFAKNQTATDYSNIDYTASKSFQFLIHDSNEISKPPAYFLSPLQQIRAGVLAQNVKCSASFNLIIKSEDGSPACVKLDTAYMLIKRGWAVSESAYPGNNPQFELDTNSTIIPGHLPRHSGIRIPYGESSRVTNYTGFVGVYNETLLYQGTQPDYVLKLGNTGTITFEIDAQATELPGQSYPTPLPKSLNLTNYAVFIHEITSLEELAMYPGVTFNGNHDFKACSTMPDGGGACIGGPSNGQGPIEAYVTDHPGVNVLFEPPLEVLPLGTHTTSQVVTMIISADRGVSQGTYLVELSPFGLGTFLLTVGNQPYHE